MLELRADAYHRLLAHAFDGLPDEACGLLAGPPGSHRVELFVPCRNVDASSRTYSIGPDCWKAADPLLDQAGYEVLGVMHSHTHTDPYPSSTDVERADNPLLAGWHYLIVSLRHEVPAARSYLLDGGVVAEERVLVLDQ